MRCVLGIISQVNIHLEGCRPVLPNSRRCLSDQRHKGKNVQEVKLSETTLDEEYSAHYVWIVAGSLFPCYFLHKLEEWLERLKFCCGERGD